MMNPTTQELLAACCFFGALVHAFSVQKISAASEREKNPTLRALMHFAGEIEIVFGLWAAIFTVILIFQQGIHPVLDSLQEKNFSEPIFVFVIMVMAASKPIMDIARGVLESVSRATHRLLKLPLMVTAYGFTLFLTPLLGSFITEPAAMTVAALLLNDLVFDHSNSTSRSSQKLLYSTVAALFVNISIGGTLTSFAAPPVLMVARLWNWDTLFMLTNFGWKTAIAVALITIFCVGFNYRTLRSIAEGSGSTSFRKNKKTSPIWIQLFHLGFLFITILASHYPVFIIASLLFFIGFTEATRHEQSSLKIRESLLVSFFLAGLVVLTGEQGWWLKPILTSLSDFALFMGATALTAITDNAAITSLAAQVSDLAESSKFAVMKGAVVGGGLTLLANAPNPAGYAILREHFRDGGIRPLQLLFYALVPTIIAGVCLWIL